MRLCQFLHDMVDTGFWLVPIFSKANNGVSLHMTREVISIRVDLN